MAVVGKWFGFGRDEIFEEALQAYERGDDESAIEGLEAFIAHRPGPDGERRATFYLASACSRLSRRYSESGQHQLALPLIERSLALAPRYPDVRLQAANLFRELGDSEREIASVKEALRLNPTYRAAAIYEVVLLYREGAHDKAMMRLNLALSRDPGLGCERCRLAQIAHSRGETARALTNLEAMSADSDSSANLHARLGDSFLRGRMFREAAMEYEKALAVAPHYADVYCRYGRALAGLDRYEDAIKQFEAAIALNDQYADAYIHLATNLRRVSRDQEAEEALSKSLELIPIHGLVDREIDRVAG